MVLDIVRDTPLWVWCVAGLLLWRGLKLTRNQIISGDRLFTLPVALLVISLTAAVTTFNARSSIILSWLLAALTAAYVWASRPQPEGLLVNRQNHTYRVPGSWVPLVLIMVAFCARYAIGIALARHPDLHDSPLFGVPSAFLFGSIGGAFLGRALNIRGAGQFIMTDRILGRDAPEDVL